MNFNQKLDLLISLGKETKTLKVEDVTRYFEKDSEEYRTVILELEHKGIEVLSPVDLEVDFPEDEENIDIPHDDIIEEEIDIENFDILPSTIKYDDPVRMYLKEIGKIQLLTFDEETRLANVITDGNIAQEQLASIEEEGYESVVDGCIFIHGEQDAKEDVNMDIYEKALEYFVTDLRSYVGDDNMPFVVTEAVTNSAKYSNKLRDIQRNITSKLTNTSFVGAKDLYSNTFESWHFDAEN